MPRGEANNQMGVIVKLEADKSDTARKAFQKSADSLAKQITPKITLDIDIDKTKDNITKTIRSIMNDMGVEVAKATKDIGKQVSSAANIPSSKQSVSTDGLNKYKSKIQEIINLRSQLNNLSSINNAFSGKGVSFDTSGVENKLSQAVKDANALKVALTDAGLPVKEIQASISGVSSSLKEIDSVGMSKVNSYGSGLGGVIGSEDTKNVEIQKQKIVELAQAYNLTERQVQNLATAFDKAKEGAGQMSSQTVKSISTFSKQFSSYLKKNPKLLEDKDALGKIENIKSKLAALYDNQSKTINVKMSDEVAKKSITELQKDLAELKGYAHESGKEGTTFLDSVGKAFEKFGGWALVTRALTGVWHECKEVYDNVVAIDTAMTELKKVTDETDATYSRFLDGAADRARSLGASLEDVVTSTADYARLGYSLDEATNLADSSIVYKNVGDGLSDINEASESIISTMKAFNIEADNSMSIVDKFNETGNNFAISSGGVGEAMKRSASALAAANNDIDESIGLITAMNTVVQDPEKVGTTLKTVSMYLRASKTEAEEAGIATDGMADSVSKLRTEILGLTGNKVDILANDDTYKSTYQILKEISEVWDQLSDVSQANLTEKLAGKRNSNALLAVLNNFDIAEEAMQKSRDAAGSASAENEKYLDSIQGRIDILTATFQEFSVTVLDSDIIKGAVSFLSNVLGGITDVTKAIGVIPSVLLEVAAAMVAIKVAGKIGLITTDTKVMGTMLSNINSAGAGIKRIASLIKETKGEATGFTATINAAAEAVATKLNSRAAEAVASTAEGAEASVSAVSASAVKAAGVAGLAIAAIAATIGIIQAYYNNIQKAAEESAKDLEEANSDVEAIQDKIKANEQEISELRKSGFGDNSERIQGLKAENDLLENQLKYYEQIAKEKLTQSVDDSAKAFTSQRYNFNTGEQTDSFLYAGNDIETAYNAAKTRASGAKQNLEANPEGIGILQSGNRGDSQDIYDEAVKAQKKLTLDAIEEINKLDEYRSNSNNEWTDSMQEAYDRSSRIVKDYYSTTASLEEKVAYARTLSEYSSVNSLEEFSKNFGGKKIEGVDALIDKIENGLNPSLDDSEHAILNVIRSSDGLINIMDETGMSETELAEAIWESINGLDGQASSADAAADALSKVKAEAEGLSDSIKSLNDAYDLLKTAQDEVNQYGNLSASTLQNILEKYPELTDKVYEFISGQTTAKDLIDSMSGAYANDVNNFNQSIWAKLQTNKSFYSNLSADQKNAINALAQSYGVDLKNVKTFEEAKYKIRSKYLKAWMELMGLNAKSSKNAVLQELNDAQKRLASAQIQGADTDSIKNYRTMVDQLKALYSTYDSLDVKFQEIAMPSMSTYNPQTHYDSNFKSSSSSSSSGKTEAEKALDAAKEAFDSEHEALENKLKRNLISEREYYNQLEALYKKYFGANTKYYLQYEAKVYEGRQKLLKSAKDDVDDFLDMVIDSIEDAKKAEKDALKDYLDDLEDLADARKEALDDLKDETDYLKKLANLRKSVADLENRLADAKLDNSAAGMKRQLELEEDLKTAKDELSEYEYEHSVEAQKSAIDQELDAEKEKVNKQIEILEDYLENQNALMTDAWAQIEGMNDSLYQKLIDWNNQYGTAIDQDVIDKWNAAKEALEAYGSVYRAQKTYEQMAKDVSGNKAPAGNSSGSSSSSSGGTSSSGKSSTSSNGSSSVSAGSRAKASSSSKIYTGINGTAKNQYFKNDPVYTVLEVRGDWVKVRHHSLKSGVTGWFKKSDLTAYAKGTNSVPYDGLFVTQEAGQEVIMHNGGLITPLSRGDMVFNNKASQRLWELSNSPNDNWFIDGLKDQFSVLDKGMSALGNIMHQDNSVAISFGDMYVSGNADESVLKQFRKDLTSDVIKALNNSHAKRGYTLKPVKRT